MIRIDRPWNSIIFGLFCAFAAILIYWPITSAGFIWDDDNYVVRNSLLQSISGLKDIWFSHKTPQYYPIVFTSFWIDYQLYGLNPLGYHLVNLAFHIANGLLICIILRKLNFRAAYWVGFLFIIHPVQVESVAWVTERKNVLSMFFYLLALIHYWKFESRSSNASYVLSLAFFLLALLSKSVTCTLPVVIALLLYLKNGSARARDAQLLAPFFLLGLVLGIHTAVFEQTIVGQSGSLYQLILFERLLLPAKAIVFYFSKLVVPYPLVFSYPKWKLQGSSLLEYWPVIAVLLTLIYCAIQSAKGNRILVVLTLAYVATLFPALGMFDVYPFRFSWVADHFQYLATPYGLTLIVLIETYLFGLLPRFVLLPITYRVCVALVLMFLTWRQTTEYKDLDTLYLSTLAKNNCSTLALNNLGVNEASRGNFSVALAYFDRLLDCEPTYLEGLQNRAALKLRTSDFKGAEKDYSAAIKVAPIWNELYYGRANAFLGMGQMRSAFRDLNQSLQLNSKSASSYALRGSLYWQGLQDRLKACSDWSRACELGSCDAINSETGKRECLSSDAK